jgi:hypothetical protein
MPWLPVNVDEAHDRTQISRADEVYAKPLRKDLGGEIRNYWSRFR